MIAIAFLLTFLVPGAGADTGPPRGHLVIVGGGATGPEIVGKVLSLAGGPRARVVILPQASKLPSTYPVERFHEAGAEDVTVLDTADPRAAIAAIEVADLIWFRGGDQTRLMGAIQGTGIPEVIHNRYRNGATVAGTSAGAAVMSRVMIAGNRSPQRQTPWLSEGLGLWPDVIVDQHFVRRNRFDRLKSAVLVHPGLLGVGIDEATAVVVSGRMFEVVGQSEVIVLDARKGTADVVREAVDGVSRHVLRSGMKFDLDKGVLSDDKDAMPDAVARGS